MLIDLAVFVLAISTALRGRGLGFVRQLFSAVGFFGGLFLGSWLQPHVVQLAHTTLSRALILVITTMSCALIGLTIGEYAGVHLKLRFFNSDINKLDNVLGSGLSVVSLLLSVWLLASIARGLPFNSFQVSLRDSRIVAGLNRLLPPAPGIIASLGHLIDPNGFPDVFIGSEPSPSQVNLPALGNLAAAVNADRGSVLRIRGQGCGAIISGSGFVIAPGLVATNAHVVAGIDHPYVQDSNQSYRASAVWFDPNLDFAVLKVPGLPEAGLKLAAGSEARGTPAAVLGYPGGGNFNAGPAAIIDEFNAVGRNIYGSGHTIRDVYEVKASVIPGNSGGPLVAANGQVIGVVFAESTSYNQVGYALTTSQVSNEIHQAEASQQAVGTGSCAE